jgi:tetratricopeptide (TPR) repeat protein
LDEAEVFCRRLLDAAPQHFQALHLLGVLEHQAGRNASAAELIAQAIAIHPREASYHCNLGVVLQAVGTPEAAVKQYDRALELKPDYAEAHFNLGNALQVLGRLDASVAHYVQALTLKPDYAVAFMNLGNVLQSLGRLNEAERRYGQALTLQPDYAEAHMNLGNVLQAQGRLDEAMARYVQAFAFRPEYADAYVNLGNLLQGQGKQAEAVVEYERALALRADYPEALVNLGTALEALGQQDEAIARYDAAIALRPEYAEAQVNRALHLLRRGKFSEGFAGYEWRWQMPGFRSPRRAFHQPLWRGEPLRGERILLHGEQGFGDSIQFLRFVSLVSAAGGRVLLEVPTALRRFVEGFCGAEVLCFGDSLPAFAWHCPLMSLPLAFATTIETIPPAPYLDAAVQRLPWKCDGDGLRVGVVWAGNEEHVQDRQRSIPLALLGPLFAFEGVRFFSLQLGRETETLPPSVMDLAPLITDFADTAALVTGLDLVISVDTAVAHLAGALGRPVWILLAQHADWRWMLGRADSPWYPTARLFRQERFGDWAGVLEKVRLALAGLRDGHTTTAA